jgi:hypothetical protein
MYVETVPNRNSPPAILLREGHREGSRVVKRTLANLSSWPAHKVELLRRVLRDEPLVSPSELFTIVESRPHGHVEVVLGMVRQLGVDRLIAAKPSRARDLVVGMIVERLLHPCSKLATTRLWKTTSLARELALEDADVDELYRALVWLHERQPAIEKKLARRHLGEGDLALYDVTSSSYEGRTCVLAGFGHDRDRKGQAVIVYGVMTDREGRPLSVQVYPGRTGDPTTVGDQVDKLRGSFGLEKVVLVGDRGMLTETQLDKLRQYEGIGWISALRSAAIRDLVEEGHLQLSLFDDRGLAEVTSPDYPGERLIACFNPMLAEERRRKRADLLEATQKELGKIERQVKRRTRTPLSGEQIALKLGKVISKYKMGKHFQTRITDGRFEWSRDQEKVDREAKLDGIYILRTSEPACSLSAEDAVRGYKSLSQVERAFRCLKGIDLRVRPIHHHKEKTVRGHIFLCLLAYYVEWHLRRALAPLLFEDEQLPQAAGCRDPVAKAETSQQARQKKASRTSADGFELHSFETLFSELATRTLNFCRLQSDETSPTFSQVTQATPFQRRVWELLGLSQ